MKRYLVFLLHGEMDSQYLSVLDEEDARDLMNLRPSPEEKYGRAGFFTLRVFDYMGDPVSLASDPKPLLKAMGEDPDSRVAVFVSSRLGRYEENPEPCREVVCIGKPELLATGWRWSGVSFVGGASFVGECLEGSLEWEDLEAFLEGRA